MRLDLICQGGGGVRWLKSWALFVRRGYDVRGSGYFVERGEFS